MAGTRARTTARRAPAGGPDASDGAPDGAPEAVTVTSENFEALLLASAGQAAALAQGAAAPARTITREHAAWPSVALGTA